MEIGSEIVSGVVVVTLAGRLDAVTAPTAGRELQVLIDRGERRLLLDCAGLRYVSSAGLHVFLVVAQCLQKRSGSLWFCSLGENLGQIFAMTDFERLFTVYPTREAALAAVTKGA
jgi:anti-sigma B factor antagonist